MGVKGTAFSEFVENLMSRKTHFRKCPPALLHASMGLSEEAGEILGIAKKSMWYGKNLDKVNLLEEMGDSIHYFQMLCNSMNVTISEVIKLNMAKLQIRYPEGYSDNQAIYRDKTAETAVFTDFVKERYTEDD